ncbi:solute carrier family 2, facilitated glucose transporter member 3 isoform X1 [Drosophila albomicans]|uniref:Solute carrier family 2, facilitated glucose transporter member 3 isoform X1 n=1 Tax=Drosophila albomicans TaxID=7291 RepID=A0A6P8WH54_DROAB|nr:solute carrier family 2, facilitated glucose transporter member 3 isoform X1 [Drosophila albomicans]
MAAESAKRLVSEGHARSEAMETSTTLPLQEREQPRWTWSLNLAGFGATIGAAVPIGYCTGVVNSPAVHMRAWCQQTLKARYDWELTDGALELLWSAVVSIFLVGGAVGSVTGAAIANKFGRRGSFYICGVLLLLGSIFFYICRPLNSVELLLLGRLLVGLAGGLITACMPMYHSELAALSQRSKLAPLCPMGLTVGVVISQICSLQSVLGTAQHWHVALAICGIFVVVCYAPFKWYPESPKWLYIVKGRKQQAAQQLQLLRGYAADSEALQAELNEMEQEAKVESEPATFLQVLRNPQLRLPLIIVCAYLGGQQLSGINAIFYYSVSIFRKAGLSAQASEWANLGAGCLNLATSLLGPMLMERVNRRPLMSFSTFFCAVFLFLFAMLLEFIDAFSWFAIGCVACIFLYIFVFQFGLGPLPFFIGAELFEVAPRSAAMSLGSVVYWMCNLFIGMAFPTLQNAWGALVFLPFSINCLLLFLLTRRYLPETRGRDPSEVAPLVADGFKSKRSRQ